MGLQYFAALMVRVSRYVLYRWLRFCIHWVQRVCIWRLFGIQQRIADMLTNGSEYSQAQLLNVLWTMRYEEGDTSRKEDFITFHSKFLSVAKIMEDPNWVSYCLDNRFVYFVNMGKPVRSFQARQFPFVFMENICA